MLDTRQTNNRRGLRWWECSRCGNQYPEDKVVVQRGLVLCTGDGTLCCGDDEYGAAYHRARTPSGYERVPEDPPNRPRSEERRVGKECRGRRAPDHEDKREG